MLLAARETLVTLGLSTPDARFNWKAGGESRFKRQTQGRRSLLVTPLRSRSIRVHASPLTLSTSQRALSPVWRPFSARFGLSSYSPCVIMLETSRDDLFLPSYQDEEMVDNLLSSQDLDGDGGGGGVSLAKALLPLVESPSPPLIPWVCSTRYKTELCTSYSATGVCKYAERCQFAHGLHELHVPFHHPKYKTELCRSYHTTGYCYYGSRCLFVHNPTEQRPAQRRRRNVPCRTFRSFGVCPFGTRCNFLHVKGGDVSNCLESPDLGEEKTPPVPSPQLQPQAKEWKPRGALCRTFSSFGFCLYGTRCRFQHGLPSKIKNSDQIQGGSLYPQLSPGSSGLPSPTSPVTVTSPNSSTSSSPSASPLTTPPAEATAHNAFTFSSQHLSDLLLPLALHLQQLESNKAQEIWDNRAL